MTPIMLDGDLYQLRLPTIFDWQQIKKYITICQDDCIPIQKRLKDKLFIMDHTVAEKMYGKQSDGDPEYLFRIERNGSKDLKRSQFVVATVLCLVPLSKDGHSIQHTFEIENPNGTIVIGGCWSQETNSLENTNLEKNPIQWVVSNGKLFTKFPTYYTYVEELGELFDFF